MDTRNEPKAWYKTRKKSNKWQAHDERIPESKEWMNEFGWHSKNAKLFRTGYKIVHWKPFSDYEPNNSHYTTVAQMGWHLVEISMKCSILFGLSISINEWLCCCCSNSLVLVNLFGVLNQCVALVFSSFYSILSLWRLSRHCIMTGGRCLVIMFPYVFVIFIRFHAEEVNKSNGLCVACFCYNKQ